MTGSRLLTRGPTSRSAAGGRAERSRWWGWLGAGLGCGILVALSVPPFGWWPLGWLGLGALAVLLPGRPARTRALIGFGAGVGQYLIGLWWVFEFSVPGCLALMLLGALFVTAAVVVVPASRRRGVALALPASFVLADWLRARYPFGGFPLGGLSLGQATSPIVPSLRLGGSLLLTAETVVVGVALAELFQLGRSWRATRSPWTTGPRAARDARRTLAAFGATAAVAVVIPLAGWLSPSGAGGHEGALRVALVQGGGPRGTRAVQTDPNVPFRRDVAASGSLEPPLDLVVWPEGAIQSHAPYRDSADAAAVAALAARLDATIVAGVEQDVGTTHYLNQVAVWTPQGRIAGTYVKNHLVPFGEYVPMRSFLRHLVNLADVPLDAIPGHGPAILRTPAAPLGVMISYEVFFDERARSGVRAGGQVLVVPTNTASYRSSQVPTQELAAARLRAWETGRWVLQVTPTGYTAVVGPTGAVVRRSTLGRQEVIVATVPRRGGRTVYVQVGDTTVAGLAAVALGAAWLSRRRARADRHHDRWTQRSGR